MCAHCWADGLTPRCRWWERGARPGLCPSLAGPSSYALLGNKALSLPLVCGWGEGKLVYNRKLHPGFMSCHDNNNHHPRLYTLSTCTSVISFCPCNWPFRLVLLLKLKLNRRREQRGSFTSLRLHRKGWGLDSNRVLRFTRLSPVLASVAQWIEDWPADRRVLDSIPVKDTCLGCKLDLQ